MSRSYTPRNVKEVQNLYTGDRVDKGMLDCTSVDKNEYPGKKYILLP